MGASGGEGSSEVSGSFPRAKDGQGAVRSKVLSREQGTWKVPHKTSEQKDKNVPQTTLKLRGHRTSVATPTRPKAPGPAH